MKTKGTHRIDVHHHIIPSEYVTELKKIGITEAFGVAFPEWSPEKSLAFMKKEGIATAITSISTPGVYFKDDAFSRNLARSCNEYMAELKRKYSGKFGGFASMPLPDVKGALDELKYALDDLKLDGVCLMTHYKGKYLGNKEFEEVFKELNQRKSVVFIHPTDPVGAYDPELGISNALIEAPFETTRAVTNLIYTGTTDRYADIRYILSHGGGTIPYLAWRIALIKYGQENKKTPILRSLYDLIIKGGPESGLKILKNMHYDTALTSSPYALKALQEFAGPLRIVFGSDFPFAKVARIVAKNLRKYNDFSEEEFMAIDNKNCLELFPNLSEYFS
jgi:predicted TIM-barrel fold metal-dependent hydrolase